MKIPNKLYDVLKWLCILALPAVADFIKFLFPTWNIPYADPIAETIRQVAFLIGILIGVTSIGYNNQQKQVNTNIADIQKDLEEQK